MQLVKGGHRSLFFFGSNPPPERKEIPFFKSGSTSSFYGAAGESSYKTEKDNPEIKNEQFILSR